MREVPSSILGEPLLLGFFFRDFGLKLFLYLKKLVRVPGLNSRRIPFYLSSFFLLF